VPAGGDRALLELLQLRAFSSGHVANHESSRLKPLLQVQGYMDNKPRTTEWPLHTGARLAYERP
jgi:hypothetical protein